MRHLPLRRLPLRRLSLLVSTLLCVSCGSPHGAPVRVIVPKGAPFRAAADSFHKAGLVNSSSLFKLYARFKQTDRNIKPGTYLMKRGTPWSEILAALHGGHGLVNTLTIPEGFTIAQISPLVAQALNVPVDSVNAAVRDTAMLREAGSPGPTLEGYLFPDTYAFPDGTATRVAVLEMVKRFQREWKPEWTQRLAAVSLTRGEVGARGWVGEGGGGGPGGRGVGAGGGVGGGGGGRRL